MVTSKPALQATPFDSLEAKEEESGILVNGILYYQTLEVSLMSPLLYKIEASVFPEAPPGPNYTVTTYVAGSWQR